MLESHSCVRSASFGSSMGFRDSRAIRANASAGALNSRKIWWNWMERNCLLSDTASASRGFR